MKQQTVIVVTFTLFFVLVWFIWNFLRPPNDKSGARYHSQSQLMDSRIRANHDKTTIDVLEYFHVTDALEVTWAHAVNSQAKLQETLAGEVMMIEADVWLRDADKTPIMAHPPSTDSDLSLNEFVKETVGSGKGIKLDFKMAAAVEPSLKVLKEESNAYQQARPVWLNADILAGPCARGSDCSIVDPNIFLPVCTKYFPSATLSIGWTTSDFVSEKEDYYDWQFVKPMRELLTNVSQPVTFPIRANMIGKSMEQILWLLSLSDDYTLTIWSTPHDKPNIKDLVELRKKVINKARIFYDLPSDQHATFLEQLKLLN